MQMKRICLSNFSATFMYTICGMSLIHLVHFEILLLNVLLYISKLCNWSPSMRHQANYCFGKAKNLFHAILGPHQRKIPQLLFIPNILGRRLRHQSLSCYPLLPPLPPLRQSCVMGEASSWMKSGVAFRSK